ncbi:DNA-processing protein DprA [Planosporangium mesophilum]|uniref:DNA processing protein DprA n=1 Tax=Planosporangium mesophilum TaxID=689768 RepID=A0A8J3T997_9ACTN|nr:DNA-processing protein DprA [Planosporangium mesophilum]GII20639.1 DNA processing protein DprA [Planosporangium mesophilum]
MTDADEVRLARVALGCLTEPGNRELGMLVRRVGPVEGLDRLVRGSVSERLAEAARLRLTDATDARVLARSLLGDADRLGARVVTPEDDEWPRQLDDLVRLSRAADGRAVERDTDPPHCLWVRGDVALDEAFDRSVAVIGARAASNYGTYVATEMAHGLAERGWTVVSGGAYGIDAAAHRAALAAGGLTAAILASGLDRPYPLGHANLFDRIGESGLLVSEWPFGSAPHRMRFLIRNRVIAAATRGTVVVEAAGRSGARQTLGRARALGRAAMAVPGPVTSAMSVGCHAELRQEGTRLVNDHGEVIEEVGRIGDDLAPTPRGPERPHDTLDPLAAQLLDAVLPRKARTAEEVAAAAGVSGRDARRTLPTLVAAGFVVEHDNGYRLAPTPP